MTKVMILSLKERFLQSIVAMILFIKVMIAIHTMVIYITCKKTNWCTFGRFYPIYAPLYCSYAHKKSYPIRVGFFIYFSSTIFSPATSLPARITSQYTPSAANSRPMPMLLSTALRYSGSPAKVRPITSGISP